MSNYTGIRRSGVCVGYSYIAPHPPRMAGHLKLIYRKLQNTWPSVLIEFSAPTGRDRANIRVFDATGNLVLSVNKPFDVRKPPGTPRIGHPAIEVPHFSVRAGPARGDAVRASPLVRATAHCPPCLKSVDLSLLPPRDPTRTSHDQTRRRHVRRITLSPFILLR
jgi:hypothetical protein